MGETGKVIAPTDGSTTKVISDTPKNSTTKKITTGFIGGGLLGAMIGYSVNKKYGIYVTIVGALVGAWAWNKYQK